MVYSECWALRKAPCTCMAWARTIGDDGTGLGRHLELQGTVRYWLCPGLDQSVTTGRQQGICWKEAAPRTSSAANFRTAVNGAASGTLNLLRRTEHTRDGIIVRAFRSSKP